jgi:pimeloyl-ACP methyl ester carboxylesterase
MAIVAIAACGSSSSPAPSTPSDVKSTEVMIPVGSRQVPGTLVVPAQGGGPGVVLMAGSGPTDRDWNSPLIPGKNGSAKLLAEALAKRGVAVLRFDKAGIGGNKIAIDTITLDVYRDEGRAALAFLRAQPGIDTHHIFIAGHSEGGLHAMRVAMAEEDHIAGLMLLSSAGRTLKDVLVTQLDRQLETALPKDAAQAEMTSLHKALDDVMAGRPVDPKTASSLPGVQQLVAGLVAPIQAKLIRDLFAFDPIAAAPSVKAPILVFNGGKDIQVDPELDAKKLDAALRAAHHDVTLVIAPDADHVLKHETRAITEVRANLGTLDYNGKDRVLDQAAVDAIAGWIAKLSSSRS